MLLKKKVVCRRITEVQLIPIKVSMYFGTETKKITKKSAFKLQKVKLVKTQLKQEKLAPQMPKTFMLVL